MSSESTSRLRRILTRGIPIVLLACVVVIVLFSLWVELHVKKMCEMATQKHPGDKVEALMMSVETKQYGYDAHLYKTNNHIFWTLGQLGDKRALPFLKGLVTGKPCGATMKQTSVRAKSKRRYKNWKETDSTCQNFSGGVFSISIGLLQN